MKKIFSIIAIIFVIIALSVCGCSSTTTVIQPAPTSSYPPTTTTTTPPPAPTLISITLTPSYPPDLTVGNTEQFFCTAIYSDGSATDITSQVTWSSYNTSVAVFYSSPGLVTGINVGVAVIYAESPGFMSAPISLRVIPALTTTTITTPAIPTILWSEQPAKVLGSGNTFSSPGFYVQAGTTLTLSWIADSNLTGFIMDANQYNNFQQSHLQFSYESTGYGSNTPTTFTVLASDTYYGVIYNGASVLGATPELQVVTLTAKR